LARIRNPYTLRQMVEIVVIAWTLIVFIAGGFLVLSAMANSLHFCGEKLCPWPFDTYAGNFGDRAILVAVGAVPAAIAILLAGILYYGRQDKGGGVDKEGKK
jgi:hypothetical protein